MDPERRAELEAAYRAALYRAGGIVLRVGNPGPEAGCWAFLTACNPMSCPLPDAENASRMDWLRADLSGFVLHEGEGAAPDGSWREPSFLVLGIDERSASGLALRYGQAAFLFGERGAPARLAWTA